MSDQTLQADRAPFPVFISYAHDDDDETDVSKRWLHLLIVQLAPLVRQNLVTVWSDKDIRMGEGWDQKIQEALLSAKAAVLLVGPYFLASEFITQVEVPMLLEKADKDGLIILPVVVRPCRFEETLFKYPSHKDGPKQRSLAFYQLAGSPKRPLSSMLPHERDEVFLLVANRLEQLISTGGQPDVGVIVDEAGNTDDHVRAVEGALDLLSNLVRESQRVREAVQRFRLTFEAASAQIKLLKTYKSLHDLLHTLQFQCFDLIMAELPQFPDDPGSQERLIEPEQMLCETIDTIQRSADQWRAYDIKTELLLADLEAADRELLAAINDQNENKRRLARSASLLSRVLNRYPTQINARLLEGARGLRLPGLVVAMTDVSSRLIDLRVRRGDVRQFIEGVESLTKLDGQLRGLLYEHDQWQAADGEMRPLDVNAEDFVEDLKFTWPRLKVITEVLYSNNPEKWAQRFVEDSLLLDTAISPETENTTQARISFRRFRRAASLRFYNVDVNLLGLCSSLQEVGVPLDAILRRLDPEADADEEDGQANND